VISKSELFQRPEALPVLGVVVAETSGGAE
jgi:hypothetical protein